MNQDRDRDQRPKDSLWPQDQDLTSEYEGKKIIGITFQLSHKKCIDDKTETDQYTSIPFKKSISDRTDGSGSQVTYFLQRSKKRTKKWYFSAGFEVNS